MNEKEIKNCPFCGGSANFYWDWYKKQGQVMCATCGARSAPGLYGKHKIPVGGLRFKRDGDLRTEIIKLWNTRVENK